MTHDALGSPHNNATLCRQQAEGPAEKDLLAELPEHTERLQYNPNSFGDKVDGGARVQQHEQQRVAFGAQQRR